MPLLWTGLSSDFPRKVELVGEMDIPPLNAERLKSKGMAGSLHVERPYCARVAFCSSAKNIF